MNNEIQEKMKIAMQKVIDSELESIKPFEGKLYAGEYDRLKTMIPLVAKGSFLEGFKTGCEVLGVNFDTPTP